MNRSDLQQLSKIRHDEAALLLKEGRFSGAFYLAGYAVECGLKACIAKQSEQYDFPERSRWEKAFTHDLTALVRVAGLDTEFTADRFKQQKLKTDWEEVVKNWSEGSRYAIWTQEDAESMLRAVDEVLRWITKRW